MSIETDSPIHSSSSDDFAALLDAELHSSGSDVPSDSDDDKDDVVDDDRRCKRLKVEVLEETQVSTSYGVSTENSDGTIKTSCPHPGFFRDMCIRCGEKVNDVGGVVPFKYIHKDLRLGTDEISRLRDSDVRSVLGRKKLYLILDLDHTLLNSTRLDDISSEEEYLHSRTDSLQDISKGSLFRLDMMRMMTKLRPFVRNFLQEASQIFEMYIYTMGEHAYAIEMAKLLDPGNLYFNSRVISQADCTERHQKGLDVVLGQESAVLILDDTEFVWQKHVDNLILMDRYHFFSSSCRQFKHDWKSLSELKSDENELDGALARVLGVLKRIHGQFFDPSNGDDYAARDVRQVRREVRKEVLKDCKIVFTRVFPKEGPPGDHRLWKMAEQLGATCSTKLGASVTHVVSLDPGTDKSRWAVREGKFLVHPRWLEAANYLWQRQPEDKFPVITKNNS
ncbi:RNA polymerase II C-terminal domain phosphatase-like 4 [Silene latifolia]|uniref:RNA polymerase II C-terminal domain phosphatase-like 4 n=1 Tax=Silene latifolia TaxID=37657 RepID=UPI003D77B328